MGVRKGTVTCVTSPARSRLRQRNLSKIMDLEDVLSDTSIVQRDCLRSKLILNAVQECCDQDLLPSDLEFKIDTLLLRNSNVREELVRLNLNPDESRAFNPVLGLDEMKTLRSAVEPVLDKILGRIFEICSIKPGQIAADDIPKKPNYRALGEKLKKLQEEIKKGKTIEGTLIKMKTEEQYQIAEKGVEKLNNDSEELSRKISELKNDISNEASSPKLRTATEALKSKIEGLINKKRESIRDIKAKLGEYKELDQDRLQSCLKRMDYIVCKTKKTKWLIGEMRNDQ